MNPTAKQALEILIDDYFKHIKPTLYLEDFKQQMSATKKKYTDEIEKLKHPIREIAEDLYTIAEQSLFLFNTLEYKIYYIVDGLKHAIYAKNPVSLANNARSLIEHIATISKIGLELNKLEDSLKNQQNKKLISDALQRTKNILNRAYYGSKSGSEIKFKPIHINDSIKALKKEIENIDIVYEFLCEYVHPNYGSNLLVTSGNFTNGLLNPNEEINRKVLDELRRICSYSMLYLKGKGKVRLHYPLRILSLLKLCFVENAKLNNLFSVKKGKPEGDGKSKDTAYFFSKARTHKEAIEMTYNFFNENNIMVISKEIGALEDEFIYDINITDKTRIWVKIKRPQDLM